VWPFLSQRRMIKLHWKMFRTVENELNEKQSKSK
jgi:hypothetical protein